MALWQLINRALIYCSAEDGWILRGSAVWQLINRALIYCSAEDGWILRGSAVTELFGVLDGFLVADLDCLF